MQTLTEDLLDIIASPFQSAARGFRSRVEIDYLVEGFTELGDPQDLNLAYGTVSRDAARHVGETGPGKEWQDFANANDGNHATAVAVLSNMAAFTDYLKSDLGAAYECTAFAFQFNIGWQWVTAYEYSIDGSSWTALTGTYDDPTATFTFTAPITARYWAIKAQAGGFHSKISSAKWAIIGTPSTEVADSVATTSYRPSRVSLDKSRRLLASQATVELPNETGGIGISPASPVKTGAPIRIYQWYGDDANEVLTFTGLVDVVREGRDPRTVVVTARDTMKRLIVQTFSAQAAQGAGEDGAVRTKANGVYLELDADEIVGDILDRAGWPAADRDIAPTGFALDEYILADGVSWAEAIVGGEALTGLTGYEAGATEQGIFYFRPMLATAAPDSDTEPTPDYSYVVGPAGVDNLTSRNVIRLDHEIDDYELKTRVKVRGDLATAKPAWTEIWHTNKFTKPVGLWYDPTDSGFLRVLDRGTKKIYRLRQSDREKVGTGIWPLDISGDVTYPLGLSGDPADSDRFWVLEAAWRTTGSLAASVHKYDASSGNHLAEYALPDGRWTDLKVSAGSLWLTNLDTDKTHKRSKADGSSVASYTTVVNGNNQDDPTGVFVDGTTLGLFFLGKARFILVDESDPTAPDETTILGNFEDGRVSTAGTKIIGGEIDTDTDAHLFACSDDLGIVWKYALTEPSTRDIAVEVVDTELEDELGFLAGAEPREHDTHPADADHPFEVRRETITLRKTINNLAQANEVAQRTLAVLTHRREVIDVATVGNPGHQRGDLLQVTDPVTGVEAPYVLDTYRDSMDDRGYFATIAGVPYDPVY